MLFFNEITISNEHNFHDLNNIFDNDFKCTLMRITKLLPTSILEVYLVLPMHF